MNESTPKKEEKKKKRMNYKRIHCAGKERAHEDFKLASKTIQRHRNIQVFSNLTFY